MHSRSVLASSLVRPSSHVAPLALIAILAIYIGWANLGFAYDDAYITYRVAHNFATGKGFVYNLGERVFCITTPGLGLLLGVAGWLFGADRIPLMSGALSGLSVGSAAIALYAYGVQHRRAVVGLLAGLLLLVNPIMAVSSGGEMPLQMALILWAFVAYGAERRIACALLLAAATVVRPDGALAAIIIGGYDLVRTRRIAWRAWLAFALALLPFVVMAWIYFGTPIPLTLGARLAQRDMHWLTFGRGLRNWMHIFLGVEGRPATYEFFTLDPRALGFWIALGLPALFSYRFWLFPLTWITVFVLSYRTIQIPFYHWYAAPAVVGMVILAACAVDAALTLVVTALMRLRRLQPDVFSRMDPIKLVAGLIVFLLIAYHQLRMLPRTAQIAPLLQLYLEAGQWLHANSPPEASVGYYEIGYLGYYAQRRVIDPLGLLDPAIVTRLKLEDVTWAYRYYQPTYIIEQQKVSFGDTGSSDWFQRDYRPVHTLRHPELSDQSLTIYQRVTP